MFDNEQWAADHRAPERFGITAARCLTAAAQIRARHKRDPRERALVIGDTSERRTLAQQGAAEFTPPSIEHRTGLSVGNALARNAHWRRDVGRRALESPTRILLFGAPSPLSNSTNPHAARGSLEGVRCGLLRRP
jgi:hypothetical protein